VLAEKELADELAVAPLISITGPWTRALEYRLLQGPPPGGTKPEPLWPGGPVSRGARFTPKGAFGSIYLASDPITALKEVEAIFVNPLGPPATIQTPPWTVFAVTGFLQDILDLTDPLMQSRLGTSISELTGEWRFPQALHLAGNGALPPTQSLGRVAFETGRILGIRYHSAKNTGAGLGLVVFADRLRPGRPGFPSFLEVYDPSGLIEQRLP
jgi:hypothetical protein